jgi:hypothetical protein
MAIRLLLRRQRGAVWSRAMVFAEPPYALRFSHFRAKAWNVEGARYFFCAAGFLDSKESADPKIEGVKDRLIALGSCYNG